MSHNSPLLYTDVFRGLIEIGCHVEELHGGIPPLTPSANESVDFEACEMEIGVLVDGIETGDEIDERLLLLLVRHVHE